MGECDSSVVRTLWESGTALSGHRIMRQQECSVGIG